jgi:hypothetical protein
MFVYERSVAYPEGHRNVVFVQRGVRPLPRLPVSNPDSLQAPAPDTQMLYRYLKQYSGVVASHTSGTDMGTDWRDNDPLLEPVVEIYQGDRQNYEMPNAPRSNSADDSIGGWRPLGFVSLALKKGYRLGFQASSDHTSTHMSYCNLWVTSPTREGIMEAFRKRRVYGSTDNILADVRCAGHLMGEEFTTNQPPVIQNQTVGHRQIRQGPHHQGRRICLLSRAKNEVSRHLLERHRGAKEHNQLLLRPRQTIRRRISLGQPYVDHCAITSEHRVR